MNENGTVTLDREEYDRLIVAETKLSTIWTAYMKHDGYVIDYLLPVLFGPKTGKPAEAEKDA